MSIAQHPWQAPDDDGHADLTSHDAWTSGAPYATLERLRNEDPVAWIDEEDGSGFWALTRYEDVIGANREWETFTSSQGIRLEEMDAEETEARRTLMETDPPDHTRMRRLLSRGFTRRTVETYQEPIRQLTAEIIDQAIERDQFDFVTEIAKELPMRMLGSLLGVPDEDAKQFVVWGDQMLSNTDPEYTDHVIDRVDTEQYRLIPFRSPAGLEVFKYAENMANQRRACPGHDVISQLLAPTTDGEPLSELEFNNFLTLLVAAGNDTTRYTLAGGMQALMENPDQMAMLRSDPSLIDSAVEEVLRWTSVTTHFRRTATKDLELHGKQINESDKVVLWWIAANYDHRKFADPYRFDLSRQDNEHMAFGRNGPHLCLGAWLARMEIRITLQELIKRTASIEPAGPAERLRSNFIAGFKHLPVRVTRA